MTVREAVERPPLTPRQTAVLEILWRSSGMEWKPGERVGRQLSVMSVRGVAEALGITSPAPAHDHLKALEKKGYIRRLPDRRIHLLVPVP